MDIPERIKQLRKQLTAGEPESLDRIREWEKEVKKIMLVQNFGDNPVVKEFRDGIAEFMKAICERLLSSEELTKEERNRLIDKRNIHLIILGFFEDSNSRLKQIEKELKDVEITNPNEDE